jgi:hypothetical protein
MEKTPQKMQENIADRILSDCLRWRDNKPYAIQMYAEYTIPEGSFGKYRKDCGRSGFFIVYGDIEDGMTMVCYNETDNIYHYRNTHGISKAFPTTEHFCAAAFNYCCTSLPNPFAAQSPVRNVLGEYEVAQINKYISFLRDAGREYEGILMCRHNYTVVMSSLMCTHIDNYDEWRCYLNMDKEVVSEEDYKKLFSMYHLVKSSFAAYQVDESESEEQPNIAKLPAPEDRDDNLDGGDVREQTVTPIINKPKEEPKDCAMRFVIGIDEDKLWAAPRYVREENLPSVISAELQKIVSMSDVIEKKITIHIEKIVIE